jgi:ribosomal-protein-alanine N-acetyltransferase
MTFRFRSMSPADAEAIAGWHYPEPFSFYDWAADSNDLAELLDPTARGNDYFAVEDEDGSLIGFFHFKTPHGPRLEIGLGLRPERTGQGLGKSSALPCWR